MFRSIVLSVIGFAMMCVGLIGILFTKGEANTQSMCLVILGYVFGIDSRLSYYDAVYEKFKENYEKEQKSKIDSQGS